MIDKFIKSAFVWIIHTCTLYGALHLNKLESPSHKNALCQFGWNWPSGSEEDFLFSSMHFRYFVMISAWIRARPFVWKNLNPHHPRMHCAKFGWNRLGGSGEDENVKLTTTPTTMTDKSVTQPDASSKRYPWDKMSYKTIVQKKTRTDINSRTLQAAVIV